MPVYVYECTKCGTVFEVEQSIKDEPIRDHPKGRSQRACGPVKRIIQAPAFHLKGSGWARDGYSSSGEKKK